MSQQSRDERLSRFSDVEFVAGIQSQMEGRLERVRQTNKRLEDKVQNLEGTVQKLLATNDQLKTDLIQNSEVTMNFGEQVAAVTVALVNAQRQNEELRSTVDNLTTNEVKLRSKIDELTAEMENLRQENSTLQANNEILASRNANLTHEVSTIQYERGLLENERSPLFTGFLLEDP